MMVTNMILSCLTPALMSLSIAAIEDTPVASMGSRRRTYRSEMSACFSQTTLGRFGLPRRFEPRAHRYDVGESISLHRDATDGFSSRRRGVQVRRAAQTMPGERARQAVVIPPGDENLPILIPFAARSERQSIALPLRMSATPQIFLLNVTPLYRSPFGVVTISLLNGQVPERVLHDQPDEPE